MGEADMTNELATMFATINAATIDIVYDAPGHDSIGAKFPSSSSSQNICRTCNVMINHARSTTSPIDYNSDKPDQEEIDQEDESVYDDEPFQESGGQDDKVAFEDYNDSDMLIPAVFFIDKSTPDFNDAGLTFEPVSFSIQHDE
jgi:hypothetical protein